MRIFEKGRPSSRVLMRRREKLWVVLCPLPWIVAYLSVGWDCISTNLLCRASQTLHVANPAFRGEWFYRVKEVPAGLSNGRVSRSIRTRRRDITLNGLWQVTIQGAFGIILPVGKLGRLFNYPIAEITICLPRCSIWYCLNQIVACMWEITDIAWYKKVSKNCVVTISCLVFYLCERGAVLNHNLLPFLNAWYYQLLK